MNLFFISDTHFGEPYKRFFLFGRERVFKSEEDYEETLIKNWNDAIDTDDMVYILGDFAVNEEALNRVAPKLKGYKILVKGNYDDTIPMSTLNTHFEEIVDDASITLENHVLYLNHYPTKGKAEVFNLVGHIHGLWKVQRNMINVSVDAWNFKPISEKTIIDAIDAINNFYDQNVFAGELSCNSSHKIEDKKIIHPTENILESEKTLFLAGPIMGALNWRKNLIYNLNKLENDFSIANPQKIKSPDNWNVEVQATWESEQMIHAAKNGVLIFWFANQETKRKTGTFAQTTRFELGEFILRKKLNNSLKIIVGFDTDFLGNESYLIHKLENADIPIVNSTKDLIHKIKSWI